MYRIRADVLKRLIARHGEFGLGETSKGARVSVGTLQKMSSGNYDSSPRETVRERLCGFFGVTESDLFEVVQDVEEAGQSA